MTRTLAALTRDLSPDELVDVGFALQQVGTQVRKDLEEVKGALRARVGPQGGTVAGVDAVASISPRETLVRAAKDADIASLQRVLGDRFGEFFRVQTTLVPIDNALERVLDLPPAAQDLVFKSIVQDIGGGGVGFNARRGS